MSDQGQGDAIVMRRYGPPAVLQLERVTLPALADGDIRVRSLASAVNHSDLEIRVGTWRIRGDDPFPYVPGLEVVGEVVATGAAVSDFRIGDRIITMMQGFGGVRAERPGGYATFATMPAATAAPVSADLDVHAVAALGLASVTAFEGLRKLGSLDGRRIAVTGAAGGVGSAAIGIARAQGADVVAIVSRTSQADYVSGLGAVDAVDADAVAAGALGEASLDGILDTVAGAGFGAYVAALRSGATLCLVGSVGGHHVAFDTDYLYDVTLTGYSTESLDSAALRRAMASITDYLRRGVLVPPAYTLFALRDAAAAHEALERHGVQGRILLVPPE
ncbi:zinc-binding dehydrogenase [Reyranella sp. CPCC 100927]|uniref:quinone oxidoreductase family protein n=1 Tax=Reyranella sp. CPCC 100927 TaxID=2599616 RepID=UPI0011B47E94|nr:zinc-binding dehydrogenase [Reyranella sp. CPCC 100927]TWS98505.1 zinc-binding dehydrogenase [Reyranella sp. CPCC 100927]